jgi:hypothetical protein
MFGHSLLRPSARRTARSRKTHLTVDVLEGRQLMSLGAEFLVAPPTTAFQVSPVNASSSNGSSVAVWSQSSPVNGQPGNAQLMGQLFNAQGGKVGPELLLVSAFNQFEEFPSVAMDANGNFVVSWTQLLPGGHTNILAQKFNASGSGVGGFVPVATGTFAQTQSSVGMDANGDFVVSYTRNTNNNNNDVFAKLYNTNGQLLTVDTVAGTSLQEDTSSVAMTPGGQFDVTWLTHFNNTADEVNVAKYTASGSLIESQAIIDGGLFNSPKIAVDNHGNAVIAYEFGSGSTSEVQARRFSSTDALGGIVDIASDSTNPSVALEGNAGAFVVAYNDGASSDVTEVNASDVEINTFNLGQSRFNPTVSINAQNQYLVTYSGETVTESFIDGRFGLL